MPSLQEIPSEITNQIVSLLAKGDLARLARCSKTLHNRCVQMLYDKIYINPRRKLPTESTALRHVRQILILNNTGNDWSREEVIRLLAKISEAGRLTNLQWYIDVQEDGDSHKSAPDNLSESKPEQRPLILPQLINASLNLVTLSIGLGMPSPSHQSLLGLQLPSLKQLHIRDVECFVSNITTIYHIFQTAPQLTDVSLDLHPYWQGFPKWGRRRLDFTEAPAEIGPVEDLKDLINLALVRPLVKNRKIRSIELSHLDMELLLPFFEPEHCLRAVKLRYCYNWSALRAHIELLGLQLSLESFHIVIPGSELQPAKAVFEALQPGLKTLIFMVERINKPPFEYLKTENCDDPQAVYVLNQESILRHSKTLRNLGLYFLHGFMMDYIEEDGSNFALTSPYMQALRPIYKSCQLRELSITVAVDWDEPVTILPREVVAFEKLDLEDLEFLTLVPDEWPGMYHCIDCDGCVTDSDIRSTLRQFLGNIFGYHIKRPALKYLLFGMQNEKEEFAYAVKWRKATSGMIRSKSERGINWLPSLKPIDIMDRILEGDRVPFRLYDTPFRDYEYETRPPSVPAFR